MCIFDVKKLKRKSTAKRLAVGRALLQLWVLLLLVNPLMAQQPVLLDCSELVESSGVAISRNNADLVWSHNDSGGKPRLYLLDRKLGQLRGVFELKDANNVDWEDMCSFRVGDQSYLAIADVGDNSKGRKQVEICIIEEPATTNGKISKRIDADKVKKITTLEVRYPGGAADCEALAFDATHCRFILLTKEAFACRVFSVPVDIQLFNDFGNAKVKIEAEYQQRFSISLVTGADICPETRRLVVCTYGTGYLIDPNAGEPQLWDKNSLIKIALPKRKQGEAIAFLNPKQLITTSEFAPTPLWTTEIK